MDFADQLPYLGLEQSDGSLQIGNILNIPSGKWVRPDYKDFRARGVQNETTCAEILLGLPLINFYYSFFKEGKKKAEDILKISGPLEGSENAVGEYADALLVLLRIREMIDNGVLSNRLDQLDHRSPEEKERIELLDQKFLFRPYYQYNVMEFLSWAHYYGYTIPKELDFDADETHEKRNTDFDGFIKSVRINYENDSQVSIQGPDGKQGCYTADSLGFQNAIRKSKKSHTEMGKTWKDLLFVLRDSPDHHYILDNSSESAKNASRARLREINSKLLKFFPKEFNISVPEKYKFYKSVKTKGPGIYQFKFKIGKNESSSTSNYVNRLSDDKLRHQFFLSLQKCKNNPQKKQLQKKLMEVSAEGLSRGCLTPEEAKNLEAIPFSLAC